ncbi:MAG: amidohydrolase family protein [Thermoguttaceae bacterium]
MNATRRCFLAQSIRAVAAGPLAATATGAFAGESADLLPIVDTHQHLWDLKVVQPPWLKPGEELTRDFVMRDYLEATAGLNVEKAVYMEVAVADEQLVTEADYVVELCAGRRYPTCAAVIGGRPAEPGFKAYMDRYLDNPYVKGVRHIMRDPKMLDADGLVAGLRLLGQRGLCFDLCVSASMLAASAGLVDACPDTRFVIDHCGNPDPVAFMPRSKAPRDPRPDTDPDAWRRDMEVLARRKNTICKISGIVSAFEKGRWTPADLAGPVNHCLDTFGPDRVVFAGDWPVCTRGAALRDWVAALKEIVASRSETDRRKLFAQNAIAFYSL